ncbi:hypothetical protein M7I_7745 [Glarea lozoyensis 74030]|uniref:Uncharacterized protein n=1 Tax=Glarea lozoyensis (strain ATCC 74030 / MF5533) TaxID=1104152 RepID=H0EY48_GLAL7|nr:hypothetical protein M7I_7745 [Glarea lozoyensis 74030]
MTWKVEQYAVQIAIAEAPTPYETSETSVSLFSTHSINNTNTKSARRVGVRVKRLARIVEHLKSKFRELLHRSYVAVD